MISKVLIIRANGILCYSKTLFGHDQIDDDFVSGFLTTILDIAQKIGGGEIRSLNFRNFNIIYSYDDEKFCIFILIADINDLEQELRDNLKLLKDKFIKRYRNDLLNWDSDIAKFRDIDEFVEKRIFIPPKILLVGEDGVGKTSIMDLLPGETVIELDDDMNEIVQKSINLNTGNTIDVCILREINIQDLIDKPNNYSQMLETADIICIVTNSGASNLTRTKNLFLLLKPMINKAEFYVIANFQDLKIASFEPREVEEFFELKTYGFSVVSKKAKVKIQSIITEVLNNTKLMKVRGIKDKSISHLK